MKYFFDVVIIGAGPSGLATALSLKNKSLRVALIEKEVFPRKKTCGDAISIDVVNQLRKMDYNIYEKFLKIKEKSIISGLKLYSPVGYSTFFKFNTTKNYGYICKRYIFDAFLFDEVKNCNNVNIFQQTKVENVVFKNKYAEAYAGKFKFTSKIVVFANGAFSNIKQVKNKQKFFNSFAAQVYFKNVKFESKEYIELHFFKQTLPNYLWIFPGFNNTANIGLGLLPKFIKKTNKKPKQVLEEILNTSFKQRFNNAQQISEIKTFPLPSMQKKRKISGHRFLLTGDAASLIDPFSGEGIANAIRSGRFAANHIISCFNKNNFSEKYNENYDKFIYKLLWKEFKNNNNLRRLFSFPALINWGIKRSNNNKFYHSIFNYTINKPDKRNKLFNPFLYLKK